MFWTNFWQSNFYFVCRSPNRAHSGLCSVDSTKVSFRWSLYFRRRVLLDAAKDVRNRHKRMRATIGQRWENTYTHKHTAERTFLRGRRHRIYLFTCTAVTVQTQRPTVCARRFSDRFVRAAPVLTDLNRPPPPPPNNQKKRNETNKKKKKHNIIRVCACRRQVEEWEEEGKKN